MSARSAAWAEPAAEQVAPGVYRIPLPLPNDGLRAVNVYAIADGERLTLIDSGWALAESEDALVRALDTLGYSLAQVSRFLITHAHRDHYTQAIALRSRLGASISLGAGEREGMQWLAQDRVARPVRQQDQLVVCGAADIAAELAALPADPTVTATTWALPDHWLDGGAEIALTGRTLRALATPGHTQGHVVFHDAAAGVLFAGDHVLPHITPSIGFEPFPGQSPLGDYLTSLLLVRTMPDARLLPAHGPVGESVHARVDQLLDHHGARLEHTLAAVAAGAHTAREVAGVLTWTRREHKLDDLDLFNRMLAVIETWAHLQVLAARGLVTATDQDGVTHYA